MKKFVVHVVYSILQPFNRRFFSFNLRWFGMLNYLTGRYFATCTSMFPLFCILLFPNYTKITLGMLNYKFLGTFML